MLNPIIRCDPKWVLLDLPTSLQAAQSSCLRIVSSQALTRPYPSIEPKGRKLDKVRASITPEQQARHAREVAQISQALQSIHNERISKGTTFAWCYPRIVPADHLDVNTAIPLSFTEDAVPSSEIPVLLSDSALNQFEQHDVAGRLFVNPFESTVTLSISGKEYLIPAKTKFILSSASQWLHILKSPVSQQLLYSSSPLHEKCFDLILMDPPWSNRSVRHSKTYSTVENTVDADPFSQTIPLLKHFLKSDGTVVIWITNKASVREQVMMTVAKIGLHLHEEWIWVKITEQGEPVYPLDGLWRKPYESLLIFRREMLDEVSTRILFAVPDLHSRKPCLVCLFERFLPSQYQALEVFARYLVSGWWSLGDEVLKFQHRSGWESTYVTS